MDHIKYKAGYKYQLVEDYSVYLGLVTDAIETDFIIYDGDTLHILKGYAWDGPSGPTLDTLNFMRGSLVHDALYQLMREGQLPWTHQEYADRTLQRICREDGMTRFRAWYVYQAVHMFGRGSGGTARRVMVAP